MSFSKPSPRSNKSPNSYSAQIWDLCFQVALSELWLLVTVNAVKCSLTKLSTKSGSALGQWIIYIVWAVKGIWRWCMLIQSLNHMAIHWPFCQPLYASVVQLGFYSGPLPPFPPYFHCLSVWRVSRCLAWKHGVNPMGGLQGLLAMKALLTSSGSPRTCMYLDISQAPNLNLLVMPLSRNDSMV